MNPLAPLLASLPPACPEVQTPTTLLTPHNVQWPAFCPCCGAPVTEPPIRESFRAAPSPQNNRDATSFYFASLMILISGFFSSDTYNALYKQGLVWAGNPTGLAREAFFASIFMPSMLLILSPLALYFFRQTHLVSIAYFLCPAHQQRRQVYAMVRGLLGLVGMASLAWLVWQQSYLALAVSSLLLMGVAIERVIFRVIAQLPLRALHVDPDTCTFQVSKEFITAIRQYSATR